PIDRPAPILVPHLVEAHIEPDPAGAQLRAVVLEQVVLGAASFRDRQRADEEIRHVAPGTPLAHQLPVEPDPLAVLALEAVADMGVAMHDAEWSGLRLL